jgi:serine/threonine-protein kinase HipA
MKLYAYIQLAYNDDNVPSFVGTAFVNERRGRLSSTFNFNEAYVSDPLAYQFDPELELALGNWPVDGALPKSFLDSSPDRWGRNLIKKRYPDKHLNDLDYLIGTSDVTRQGALRFKTTQTGKFEYPGADVPKLIALPELLDAANMIEKHDRHENEAVKLLLDAGTGSLGGARPKAAVQDGGKLYMAKFPHIHDEYDVIGAEYDTLMQAKKLGIHVPRARLVKISGVNVLLTERFDRVRHGNGNTVRVGYMSALTLLGAADGERRDYLEIASAISHISADATADLHELFARIAFTVKVNNTDDHLRNHGFLRADGAWRLSPMFDVNPEHDEHAERATSIGGALTHDDSIKALLDNCEQFRFNRKEAVQVLNDIL